MIRILNHDKTIINVGDLVTVLPAGDGTYLVVEYLQPPTEFEIKEGLGSLWTLYNEDQGIFKMHEKWLQVIS